MRRCLQSEEQRRDGRVVYELDDGRYIELLEREIALYGLQEIVAAYGLDMPTEPIPLMQGGRQIGTVPADFHPMGFESQSAMYDPRLGDFRMEDDAWVAHNSLGYGDIEAIPGFLHNTEPRLTRSPEPRVVKHPLEKE